MQPKQLVGDEDSDAVLALLDAHTVRLSQGTPLHLLRERWCRSGYDDERLAKVLARLIAAHWIEMSPGVSPPHVRVSASGYQRLLAASAPAPSARDAAPKPADARPRLFLGGSRKISEIALRNQVLAIFRDFRLGVGDKLIGITASRYWQETGLRAGDLRTGFDVLLRDGYVLHHPHGLDMYWELTDDGASYVNGPVTPASLLNLAPTVSTLQPQPPDGDLRDLLAGAFSGADRQAGAEIEFPRLQARWFASKLDDNALLHALDLGYKAGIVELRAGEPLVIVLTPAGARRKPEQRSMLAHLADTIGELLR